MKWRRNKVKKNKKRQKQSPQQWRNRRKYFDFMLSLSPLCFHPIFSFFNSFQCFHFFLFAFSRVFICCSRKKMFISYFVLNSVFFSFSVSLFVLFTLFVVHFELISDVFFPLDSSFLFLFNKKEETNVQKSSLSFETFFFTFVWCVSLSLFLIFIKTEW